MNPAASEPALSEVEGTEARKRNIFAETTILYARRQLVGEPDGLLSEWLGRFSAPLLGRLLCELLPERFAEHSAE